MFSSRSPLRESLLPGDAKLIFQRHGATLADLSDAASLKATRIRLIRANDPNRPLASQTAAQEINAAYDVLKVTMPNLSPPAPPPPQRSYELFKDMRYFIAYFAAHRDSRPCTLRNFDGVSFGRSITINGTPARHQEMAHAMLAWAPPGRAIFAHYDHLKMDDQRHQLHLIYLDGRFLDGSTVVNFTSITREPRADANFMRQLPKILDVLAASGNL